MAYFPNMTSWEYWAADNCFKCLHWPRTDEAPGCPVDMAHTLYSYDLCNESDHPGKVILDMLIPENGTSNGKCAMFANRNGLTEKHMRDWEKYKAVMAEMSTPTAVADKGEG
jgi:hypothetical protein